jgi:hypothetical protein
VNGRQSTFQIRWAFDGKQHLSMYHDAFTTFIQLQGSVLVRAAKLLKGGCRTKEDSPFSRTLVLFASAQALKLGS